MKHNPPLKLPPLIGADAHLMSLVAERFKIRADRLSTVANGDFSRVAEVMTGAIEQIREAKGEYSRVVEVMTGAIEQISEAKRISDSQFVGWCDTKRRLVEFRAQDAVCFDLPGLGVTFPLGKRDIERDTKWARAANPEWKRSVRRHIQHETDYKKRDGKFINLNYTYDIPAGWSGNPVIYGMSGAPDIIKVLARVEDRLVKVEIDGMFGAALVTVKTDGRFLKNRDDVIMWACRSDREGAKSGKSFLEAYREMNPLQTVHLSTGTTTLEYSKKDDTARLQVISPWTPHSEGRLEPAFNSYPPYAK